jgi:hypothetical protein
VDGEQHGARLAAPVHRVDHAEGHGVAQRVGLQEWAGLGGEGAGVAVQDDLHGTTMPGLPVSAKPLS